MIGRCSAPKCRKGSVVKGLCHFHYARQRNGVPLDQPKQRHRKSAAPNVTACIILDCGRKVAALGMCWAHYRRQLRGQALYVLLKGNTSKASAVKFGPRKPTYREKRIALFRWALENDVTPEPNTGCWLWLGEHTPAGYGRIGNDRDPWSGYAHRAALYFTGVSLQRRTMARHVRHTCDQPACVNPQHLVYGTAQENALDRSRRGRTGVARFTPDDIRAMRAEYDAGEPIADIARRWGVGWQHARQIVKRELWAWVDAEVAA